MTHSRVLKLIPGLLLVMSVLSLSSGVASVQAQEKQDLLLEPRRQAERMNEQRLASLVSAVGIQLDAASRFTPGQTFESLQLQLTTNTSASNGPSLSNAFSTKVNSRERRAGELPRHRSVELSSQHLFVVTVDKANRLRWWSLIPDPRIVRAEEPDANNRLSGRVIYQPTVDTVVEIPDDEAAAELRFYHPQWSEDRFVLTLVGVITLNKN